MPKLIIGLVGLSGCGKGTVADILKEKYGADYSRFSAIIGAVADTLSLEKSRENMIKLSVCLRREFGEDVFSYAIEKHAVLSTKDIVIIDGIRRPEDIVALEPLPMFKLVAIEADERLRYERMKNRGEKSGESDMTWGKFQAESKAPTEVAIPLVMERAWRTIPNNGTQEELTEAVHEMMTDLGFKPKK